MFKRNLIRNKLYGIALIGIGMLSVLISKDATFFLIALILGGYLIISKENWIDWSIFDFGKVGQFYAHFYFLIFGHRQSFVKIVWKCIRFLRILPKKVGQMPKYLKKVDMDNRWNSNGSSGRAQLAQLFFY